MKVYIAGPFFNENQRHMIRMIESILDEAGILYFSPRSSEESKQAKAGMRPDLAKSIFEKNIAAIELCDTMLVSLDYPMPADLSLRLVDSNQEMSSDPISLPDTGTVWELGYGFALGMDLIGFSLKEEHEIDKLNLMLLKSLDMLLLGYVELRNYSLFCSRVLNSKGM